MTYLRYVLMTFYFLVISSGAHAQIATLDGNWHSPQWKYGYVLKDGMGIATSTNSPNFQVGQNIIQLTATSPNTFTGQQVYTDGKFYKVTVTLLADGRLSFVGEKNVKWVMERIGAPPQASSSASQPMAPAPSATANSPSFDCRKATTTVEKLICTNPELSKLDVGLAEMYKEAVSKAPSIRDDQRAWNVEKNKCTDTDCLKTTYEDRISQLVNFIVRHDRAALRQDQASVNTSNGSGDKSGLDFLFKQGGYWVEEKPPGQSCDAALAQETLALVFKRYNASQTEILMRIGGQHSFKNDPSVAARLNLTINVPTQYVVIGNSPKTKIKVITGYPNGAIIEELFDLSPRDNTLVKYGVGSCSSCDQAQLRIHQSFSGPEVMQWCSGNIGGASQTQPQTNASNNQTQDTKPVAPAVAQREEGYVQINPSSCLKIKGTNPELKEIAANHLKAGLNQIDFVRTELNSGMCLIVWSHPRGICKSPTYVAFQHAGTLSAVDVVKFDYQKNSITKQLSMMCF